MSSVELETGLERMAVDLGLGYTERMDGSRSPLRTLPQYIEHYFLLRRAPRAAPDGLRIGAPMTWAEAAGFPMCLLSAIGGVWLSGRDNDIFTQIGLVVLVGLSAKNAILIVEFARQREEAGLDRFAAAVEACRLRLRPILMTSFAFILGVVPLVLARGAGAEMRQALGTAVFYGMLGVTFFGLLLTPVFYLVIRGVTARLQARRAKPALATIQTQSQH